MPLSATNFVTKGPVLHNDMLQFFNLFTGVMVDQPVTFKNTLSVGGSQGTTTVPMKLYGAVGQTSHLLDLYVDPTNANPGWGIAATGNMGWGPGGAAPTDTTLSRVALQNGHSSDTAGVLVTPYLEVAGNISATTYLFPNGATLTGPTGIPLQLNLNQDLLVQRHILVGGGSPAAMLRVTASQPSAPSLDSLTSNSFVTAKLGTYITGNAYVDDASNNWFRYDTSQPSMFAAVTSASFIVQGVVAGANPITAWSTLFNVDNTGVVQLSNTLRISAASPGVRFPSGATMSDYSQSGQAYVAVTQMTVTPGDLATASIHCNGPLTVTSGATTTLSGAVGVTGALTVQSSLFAQAGLSVSGAQVALGSGVAINYPSGGQLSDAGGGYVGINKASIQSAAFTQITGNIVLTGHFLGQGIVQAGATGNAAAGTVALTNGIGQGNGAIATMPASKGSGFGPNPGGVGWIMFNTGGTNIYVPYFV